MVAIKLYRIDKDYYDNDILREYTVRSIEHDNWNLSYQIDDKEYWTSILFLEGYHISVKGDCDMARDMIDKSCKKRIEYINSLEEKYNASR